MISNALLHFERDFGPFEAKQNAHLHFVSQLSRGRPAYGWDLIWFEFAFAFEFSFAFGRAERFEFGLIFCRFYPFVIV
ncbi:hypothetical protein [Paenibacillus sp. NPDC058174]|uniref:hypothetical protein n=1 Tax=Paenibacillus sp. NPDC058174 TaxID=3346366 RepID=UPI0036D7644F